MRKVFLVVVLAATAALALVSQDARSGEGENGASVTATPLGDSMVRVNLDLTNLDMDGKKWQDLHLEPPEGMKFPFFDVGGVSRSAQDVGVKEEGQQNTQTWRATLRGGTKNGVDIACKEGEGFGPGKYYLTLSFKKGVPAEQLQKLKWKVTYGGKYFVQDNIILDQSQEPEGDDDAESKCIRLRLNGDEEDLAVQAGVPTVIPIDMDIGREFVMLTALAAEDGEDWVDPSDSGIMASTNPVPPEAGVTFTNLTGVFDGTPGCQPTITATQPGTVWVVLIQMSALDSDRYGLTEPVRITIQ